MYHFPRLMVSFRAWMLVWSTLPLTGALASATTPAPIIELGYVSPQSNAYQFSLRAYADGTVIVADGLGDAVQGQLPPQRLHELIHDLLVDDGLAETDSDQIASEIQRASIQRGLTATIPGADETIIRIHTSRQQCERRCRAVGLLCTRFPGVPALERFARAQARLENLRAIVLAGGHVEADTLTQLANRRLRAEHPEHLPLTTQDLTMVRPMPAGGRYVQFCRRDQGLPATEQSTLIVSIIEVPGTVPRVNVFATNTPTP